LPAGSAGSALAMLERGAERRASGDSVAAREAFLEAARLARAEGDPTLLAEAALGHGEGSGGLHRGVRYDLQQISLLEEALAALPQGDSALRVRLFARLAEELAFTPEQSARSSLAAEAVAMAGRLGDRRVLLAARYSQELCRVGPDLPVEERLASTRDLVDLAAEVGDVEAEYLAHMLRELAFVEAGRMQEAACELEAATRLADRLPVPALRAWALSGASRQAWLRGSFAEAERLNGEALERALQQGGEPDTAQLVVGGQLLAQQLLRAPVGQFAPVLQEYRVLHPHMPVLTCFLAYALAEGGDLQAARTLLDELAEDGLVEMPRTTEWGTAMWALARCAAMLEDVELGALVQAQLARSSGRWFADWASTCLGPVDTTLAVLAALRQRWDEAERLFQQAVLQAREARCPPWAAEAQVRLAESLLRKGDPQDRPLARQLLDEAVGTCRALGLGRLGEHARALLVP